MSSRPISVSNEEIHTVEVDGVLITLRQQILSDTHMSIMTSPLSSSTMGLDEPSGWKHIMDAMDESQTDKVSNGASKSRKSSFLAKSIFYCSACELNFVDEYGALNHKNSLKHKKKSGEISRDQAHYKKDTDVTPEDLMALVDFKRQVLGILPFSRLRYQPPKLEAGQSLDDTFDSYDVLRHTIPPKRQRDSS